MFGLATVTIIDIVLLMVVAETAAVISWRIMTGKGPAIRPFLVNVCAGACLVLALRAALANADFMWIAACLAGSLLAHLADLRARWSDGPINVATVKNTAQSKEVSHA
jgi:hypothetical protein